MCSRCAANFVENGGNCVPACVSPTPKFNGVTCRPQNENCTTGYKDNG